MQRLALAWRAPLSSPTSASGWTTTCRTNLRCEILALEAAHGWRHSKFGDEMFGFTSRTWPAIAAAVVLTACSDSATAPITLDANEAVVGVLPSPTAGSTTIPLATGASWTYCGSNSTLAPTNATIFAGGGGSAFNLTAAIAAF